MRNRERVIFWSVGLYVALFVLFVKLGTNA